MKNLIKKIGLYLKPTEESKHAVKSLKVGDIIYIRQGGHPHKEVAGYQFVTKVINEKLEVTWGGGKLSKLKEMQSKIYAGAIFRMLYWHDVIINPETGYIKDHGDLRVNEIVRDGKSTYLYPSNNFYYFYAYGVGIVLLCLLLGIIFLFANYTSITGILLSLCGLLFVVI